MTRYVKIMLDKMTRECQDSVLFDYSKRPMLLNSNGKVQGRLKIFPHTHTVI